MELKVQCESLKYDVKEKTELLSEASKALDQMESKMASMASEREDERLTLEEKLRQIDEIPENQRKFKMCIFMHSSCNLEVPKFLTIKVKSQLSGKYGFTTFYGKKKSTFSRLFSHIT